MSGALDSDSNNLLWHDKAHAWGWGNGAWGKLGQTSSSDIPERDPTLNNLKVWQPTALKMSVDVDISTAECGSMHTMMLDTGGCVWVMIYSLFFCLFLIIAQYFKYNVVDPKKKKKNFSSKIAVCYFFKNIYLCVSFSTFFFLLLNF